MSDIGRHCTHDSSHCIQIPKMLSIFSPSLTQEWPCCFPPLRVRLCLEADTFLSSSGCVCLRFLSSVSFKAVEKAPSTHFHPLKVNPHKYSLILSTTHPWWILRKQKGDSLTPVSSYERSHNVVGSKTVSCVQVGYLTSRNLPTSFFPCPYIPISRPQAPHPKAALNHVTSVVWFTIMLKIRFDETKQGVWFTFAYCYLVEITFCTDFFPHSI